MKIKFLVDEDCINYKKISMFVGFPTCTWKCGKENCQNYNLDSSSDIEISKEELCERYLANPITEAIVCAGLEPFDSVLDLYPFLYCLRNNYNCNDDIVIYTGYTEEELSTGRILHSETTDVYQSLFQNILKLDNIIIKYGRYIANEPLHYDPVLGVNLASTNQYAKEYRNDKLHD